MVHPWLSTEYFLFGGWPPFLQGILFWGNDFWPFPTLECDAFSSGCSQNAHDELKGSLKRTRGSAAPPPPCLSCRPVPRSAFELTCAVCTLIGSEKSLQSGWEVGGWRAEGGSEGPVERRKRKMVARGRGRCAARRVRRSHSPPFGGFCASACSAGLSARALGRVSAVSALSAGTRPSWVLGGVGCALLLMRRVEAVFCSSRLWFKDICVRELTFSVV